MFPVIRPLLFLYCLGVFGICAEITNDLTTFAIESKIKFKLEHIKAKDIQVVHEFVGCYAVKGTHSASILGRAPWVDT